MRIELLTTLKDNLGLKEKWNELADKSNSTIFSKYAFFNNWEKVYGDIFIPNIYLMQDDEKLVGIAPLTKENDALKFATGTDYKGLTDYCDFIVDPNYKEEAYFEIKKILKENENFNLREIPENSETIKYFFRENFVKIEDSIEPVSYINLPAMWEEYHSKLRDSYKKSLRKFNSDFPNARLSITQDKSELEKNLEIFIRMHQEEWTERGKGGCFAEDEKHKRFLEYHKNLASDLLDEKNLYLALLTENENIIASEYCFLDKNNLSDYLGGINESYKKYSPGRIIMLNIIEDIINKGIKKYDLLRGDEQFKNDFLVNWSKNKTISSY